MAARLAEVVESKGGTIAIPPYLPGSGRAKRVGLRCAQGHEWDTQVGHITSSGSWCPHCYGNAPRKLSDLQSWAESLGGKCLSAEYGGSKHGHLWECGSCQYQWTASWNNVSSKNSWCPQCKHSIREVVTRAAFQEMLPGESFDTDRAAIGMELDGYSERYSLAFECDGMQHRVRVPHFQRAEGDFEGQLARDAEKDDETVSAGIILLRIPDRGILPLKNIRAYVHEQVIALKWVEGDLFLDFCSDQDFYVSVRTARTRDKYIKDARAMVEAKGGVLHTETCPIRTWVLHATCDAGHSFETHFDNLERGRWCPECSRTRAKTEDEVRELVQARGYAFIDTSSRRDGTGRCRRSVQVQCPNKNHPPCEMGWDNFRSGRGCAKCGVAKRGKSRRLTAESLAAVLSPMNLSVVGEYLGNSARTRFGCTNGHEFTAVYQSVKAFKPPYCPVCTIDAMPGVSLVGAFDPNTNFAKDKLTWLCSDCGRQSITTYRGMRIRRHKCPNKACPNY